MLFAIYACSSRDTGLFTHTKGYFIKDGDRWEEYLFDEKQSPWSAYSTYDEDGEYYYVSNDICSLAVPKAPTENFLLYGDDGWTELYETCRVLYNVRGAGGTSSSGFLADVYEESDSVFVDPSEDLPYEPYMEEPDSLVYEPFDKDTAEIIARQVSESQENLKAGLGNGGSSGQSKSQADAGRKKSRAGIKDKSSELKALYDKASAYDDKEDYGNSFPLHKQAAEQGYAPSQYRLGDMYHYGTGVTQNYSEALKWYRLAAVQGNVDAQKSLGFMYALGTGVTKDDSEALKWYRLAADQGDAGAQQMLGAIYEYGRGVTKDRSEALKWYRLAAAQGLGLSKEAVERLESEEEDEDDDPLSILLELILG